MKGTIKAVIAIVILLSVVFMMSNIVRAEEPDNVNQLIEDKVYMTYNEYYYPCVGRMFYLPRWHEVKFDVHNGKFFELKYFPHHSRDLSDIREESEVCYSIYFYTPTGELFGVRYIRMMDKNRYYSIPHNDRTPNCERLIVKIQNNTDVNKDFAFKILDPVDPVKGTPMKDATFRTILHY